MNAERAELLAQKKELESRINRIRRDIATRLSADFAEQATELENRDVLLEIARVSEENLESINKKLQ